jgi:putative ATP-binding cassette transporter
MRLFSAFTSQAPNQVFTSILLGASAGIAYSLLIPIVVSSLRDSSDGIRFASSDIETILGFQISNFQIATLFFFTCLFILFARTASQIVLMRVSMNVTTDLRVQMYNRISCAAIEKLERLGSSKLIATITTDVGRIVGGARMLPDLLMNAATLVGMLGFLLLLNPAVFWFVLQTILFGVITYQIPMFFGNRYFSRSRESVDSLQESIRGLIYGAKELKLNKTKRDRYFKDILLNNEYAVLNADKTGNSIVSAAVNYGDLISFFVIGMVAFIFVNYQTISNSDLVAVIMALLYITTPISVVINFLPGILRAKISLRKVNELMQELSVEEGSKEVSLLKPWQQIRFEAVTFRHASHDGEQGFSLAPLSFSINKGEITFIVGGNGSGKSTLSKLLTLHYKRHGGDIFFGDEAVTSDNLNSCRQVITAIFSDYYMFDRLLDTVNIGNQDMIESLLHELDLSKKVKITDGHFSTTSLSDGQRRRLALLVSFLENKELYVFDEWAADQDPMFKETFYHQVLPKLKKAGKAVVVISHDDRYFDIADKVLVMADGQLVDTLVDSTEIIKRSREKSIVVKRDVFTLESV